MYWLLIGNQKNVIPNRLLLSPMTLETIPNTTLIIGTDAAGKDHVANILATMISEEGGTFEKRKRYLTGKLTRENTSTAKSNFELFLEKGFVNLYPYFGFLLPRLTTQLLQHDINKFRQSDKKLIIIGHNCLRGLAFHWGQRYTDNTRLPVFAALEKTLGTMRRLPGLHTIVLDVDDEIRKKRIGQRRERGEADIFDEYMAADSQRSERIESVLVWLARTYLGGQLIVNNDLPENELRRLLLRGFSGKT